MDRYTRWAALLDLLGREERLTVEGAAERLGVSQATVRRDFDALAKQRKLVRLRGAALSSAAAGVGTLHGGTLHGATLHGATLHGVALATIDHRGIGHLGAGLFDGAIVAAPPPHARRIAGQVAGLVRAESVVGLVGSALIAPIARALGVRFEVSKTVAELASAAASRGATSAPSALPVPTALTVLTSNLAVAVELARRPGFKVVATGGVLSPASMTLTGPLAGLLLQGISLDTVVIAADAVDPEFGVTAADEVEGDSCALMIGRAHHVIVAAGSGDLDRRAFARVCGAERIDMLVTDAGVAPATSERFAKRGVRVVVA